jgi:hypothetical protein
MKPYGVTKYEATPYPDKADAGAAAMPSKIAKLKSAHRRAVRRIQKRRARADGKALAKEEG